MFSELTTLIYPLAIGKTFSHLGENLLGAWGSIIYKLSELTQDYYPNPSRSVGLTIPLVATFYSREKNKEREVANKNRYVKPVIFISRVKDGVKSKNSALRLMKC